MKTTIIMAIIGVIVAFAAMEYNGGKVAAPVGSRTTAARTSRRGISRRNMASGSGRGNDSGRRDDAGQQRAGRSEREISAVGIVRSVVYQSQRARSAMEEAFRAAGVQRDNEYAVVTVDTQEHGRMAVVYRRASREWRKVRRFFQVGHPATVGSRVKLFGFVQAPTVVPVDVLLGVGGVMVTPDAVTFYERDRHGENTPFFNQVVDGVASHERTVVTRVAKQGFCMRCRENVDREDVEEIVFQNGRAASRGRCVKCGAIVFRTGGGATELQTRLQAEMSSAAA